MPSHPRNSLSTFSLGFVIIFLSTTYYYFGRSGFLSQLASNFSPGIDVALWGGPYQCGAALLLLLAPALLLARLWLGIPLAGMGFALGDWRFGLKVSIPAAAVAAAAILLAGGERSGLCTCYPLSSLAFDGGLGFVAWAACYLVYYVAWEGLFRGVIQIGLDERLGVVPAILLQTALSTLLHAGHPEMETYAALVAGPVFGLLALRTGSILYVLLIHAAVGLATDLSCVLAA